MSSNPSRGQHASCHVNQKPRTDTSQSVERLGDPIPIIRKLRAQKLPQQQPYNDLRSIADGFEAHEFVIVRSKKSQRRKMNGIRESKATMQMPRLKLSNGLLPPPALQYYDPVPAPSPPKVDFSHTESAALLGQLTLTKLEAATRPKYTNEHNTQRLEVVVRNQLSSITAAVRRDTENLGSDVMLKHQTSDNEEYKCSDGTDDTTHLNRFRTSDCTPTSMEDTSYFETAMHHPDARRGLGNVDEVVWSYQNACI
jgi:hypothetical protein